MPPRQSHSIRRGAIKATIRARHKRHRSHLRLSVCRLLRDGDRWRQSSRFTTSDLPLLRLVLNESYVWMLTQQQLAASERPRAKAKPVRRPPHA